METGVKGNPLSIDPADVYEYDDNDKLDEIDINVKFADAKELRPKIVFINHDGLDLIHFGVHFTNFTIDPLEHDDVDADLNDFEDLEDKTKVAVHYINSTAEGDDKPTMTVTGLNNDKGINVTFTDVHIWTWGVSHKDIVTLDVWIGEGKNNGDPNYDIMNVDLSTFDSENPTYVFTLSKPTDPENKNLAILDIDPASTSKGDPFIRDLIVHCGRVKLGNPDIEMLEVDVIDLVNTHPNLSTLTIIVGDQEKDDPELVTV